MSRDAFLELRAKIQRVLSASPSLPGRGEVLSMENDPDTGDLMVTSKFGDGEVRTHRITITNETPKGTDAAQ